MNRISIACVLVLAGWTSAGWAKEPVAATPQGSPGAWIGVNDYPTAAMRDDHQGIVGFRLDVGSDGLVRGCTITQSSSYPELDEATCRLVTLRARFSPARDSAGRAVSGMYTSRVRWTLPSDPEPDPMSEGNTYVTFIRGVDGGISDCHVSMQGEVLPDASAAQICKDMAPHYSGYTDQAGKPVAKRITFETILTVQDP